MEQVTRNCKDESEAYRALIAMAVGLDDCKDQVQQAMGIRHQKPQKAQLREEAKRRYIVLGLETRIPFSLGRLRTLSLLDVDGNEMEGEIPLLQVLLGV